MSGRRHSERVLLDSVILIDHLNRVLAAKQYIESVRETAMVSVITRLEVLSGGPEAEIPAAKRLLESFPLLEVGVDCADLASGLRRRHRWTVSDALQAALAQLHGLQLATRNTRDFPPQKHRFVTIPYRID